MQSRRDVSLAHCAEAQQNGALGLAHGVYTVHEQESERHGDGNDSDIAEAHDDSLPLVLRLSCVTIAKSLSGMESPMLRILLRVTAPCGVDHHRAAAGLDAELLGRLPGQRLRAELGRTSPSPHIHRCAVLAIMLATATQATAVVNPATAGYCVAVSGHVAQQLRQSGRLEMAERLMGANTRLQGLLDTPEERRGFERAFEAATPERFTPQRLNQAITQCSQAFAAAS